MRKEKFEELFFGHTADTYGMVKYLPDPVPSDVVEALLSQLIAEESNFGNWANHPEYIHGRVDFFDETSGVLKGTASYKGQEEKIEIQV